MCRRFEIVSSGVRTGHRDDRCQRRSSVELGDLVLDNAAPRVLTVVPADRVAGVPVTSPISITFSEAMPPPRCRRG